MAYTYDQLVLAYKAVHDGIAPDPIAQNSLQGWAMLNSAGQMTDAQVVGNIINTADNTTAVAVLAYQFFTGKSPTAAGLDFLVNSASNPNDLNDAYYSKFNLENRYINFAANLGVNGAGAGDFATKYGALSYGDFVASIYETIIGSSYAQSANIDPKAAIASIVSRQAAILASSGINTAGLTAAQIDIATKAATVGYLLGEAIKADVGLYAAASNNFMLALMQGNAVYNTNITLTYAPTPDSGAHGNGHTLDRGPTTSSLPDGTVPPTTTPPPAGVQLAFTTGVDHITGTSANEAFTATDLTFNASDVLNGGGGADSLTITAATGSTYTVAAATITSIPTITVTNNAGVTYDARAVSDATQLTVNSVGLANVWGSANTNLTVSVGAAGGNDVNLAGGKDVNLTVTGNTGGDITVGSGTGPTGAVTISDTTAGAVFGGTITVRGGTSINITQAATNANNTTQYNGDVQVTGTAVTTSVTVHSAAQATADINTPGVVAASVTIYDVNGGSASTQVGKITAVNVDGYGYFFVRDNALSSLTLGHGGGSINIDNRSSLASGSQTTTLNLTVNGLTGGTLADRNIYTTMNFTTGATASTLSSISDTALTTLTVAGSSALNIGPSTLTALTSVTVSGAAGLTSYLAGSNLLATYDAHASTGANTTTFSGSNVALTYTGGSGVDTIVVGGQANTISVGAGSVADSVRIFAAGADVNTFTTITDAHAGLNIGFTATGAEVFNNTPVTGAFASVRAGADAAINSLADGSTNGQFAWFQYNGDTYIVESTAATHATFNDGVDHIVKLTGNINLGVGHASVVNHFVVLA